MTLSTRSLALLTFATALVACGGKPTGGAPSTAAGGPAAAAGEYHGVAIYPGAALLTSNDIGAGAGGTLHSGNFRSTDPQDKIAAFYRAALTRQFGTVGDMPGGSGMVRIASGNNVDQQVTVLIRQGDSGEQIIGLQVASKN